MPTATTPFEHRPLLLDVSNTKIHLTPDQFGQICIDNPDLRLELAREGELIVMAPAGGESGKRNLDLMSQVSNWNRHTKLGVAFDSSTGYDFTARDGGILSPDGSWIEKSRLEGVDIRGFIPVVPDFVLELRSESDRLSHLESKMNEYQRLGVKLSILINPQNKIATVYRAGRDVEILDSPMSIDCSDVMPGFSLSLSTIW